MPYSEYLIYLCDVNLLKLNEQCKEKGLQSHAKMEKSFVTGCMRFHTGNTVRL